MTKREKAVWVLLCLAAAAALAVPAWNLFLDGMDGIYSWHVRQPEFIRMAVEVAGLALILGTVWLLLRGYGLRLLLTGIVCAVFVWCHVVFLPMVVSGIYVLYLYLMGYTVRRWLIRLESGRWECWLWDFLLGCAAVITLFCLMSAAGAGSIPMLKAAVAVTGIGAVLGHAAAMSSRSSVSLRDGAVKRWELLKRWQPLPTRIQSLLLVFILLMVLIQVGRMNISLDFDSLWYGVRSEYILNNGRGIYEDMGSVGVVYTYSKGLEVLLLPLSDLASHSYLLFFNVWMAVLSLVVVYRIGRFYMVRTHGLLAAACVSSIPAVMNMSITAKADSMTLLLQLIMIWCLLSCLRERMVLRNTSHSSQKMPYFIAGLSALLLSFTMKPTAVIFSAAIMGMSLIYFLLTKQLRQKAAKRTWLLLLLPAAALFGIWARTLKLVGVPVTSVFSSLFVKAGFTLQYPFAAMPLDGNGGGGFHWGFLADTLYRMLLNPTGDDMDHVVIAWGTSLLFLMGVITLLLWFVGSRGRKLHGGKNKDNLVWYAHTVMVPFLLVCIISLMMLGQIDGNYFMLLYVGIVLYGCVSISRVRPGFLRTSIYGMTAAVLVFNIPVTMVSNWAWSLGFTPVSVVNEGYINHRRLQQQEMEALGNRQIWNILSEDPQTRIIAAGSHPQVFQFPCNVQSYEDITSTWGNVRLVKTMDGFVEYLDYAETDYIYMQAGYVERESRCYELMGYLIEAGILTDVVYEAGNLLARVDLQGEYGAEASKALERYGAEYQVRKESP